MALRHAWAGRVEHWYESDGNCGVLNKDGPCALFVLIILYFFKFRERIDKRGTMLSSELMPAWVKRHDLVAVSAFPLQGTSTPTSTICMDDGGRVGGCCIHAHLASSFTEYSC